MPRKRKQRIISKHLDEIAHLMDKKPIENELFCQPCDRKFLENTYLKSHLRTKGHKRRLKELKSPFSKKKIEEINGFYS